MKVYRITTGDFINLKKVENITNKTTLEQVEQVENTTGDKIIKVLTKGDKGNTALMIGKTGKYYITARPCYIDSLVSILQSVGITNDEIVQVKKASNTQAELSLEQLKTILKN